jgi:hypothetical protein
MSHTIINTSPPKKEGGRALLCHILDPARHGMNNSVEMM